jgi:DNA-binding HxlR family transcriptional regulator
MRKAGSINARNEAEFVATCPIAAAMALIGGRWKVMILWYVGAGLDRYGALRRTIPNISGKMLYQQLRELERDGLLLRVFEGRAVRYRLTALGASVQEPLGHLERWSRAHDIPSHAIAVRSGG